MMTDTIDSGPGPLKSFALMLFPWVMTGFYFVYALLGWVLEPNEFIRWAYEAREVSNGILLLTVILNVPSWLYGHYHGLPWLSRLKISATFHILIALMLTGFVYYLTR